MAQLRANYEHERPFRHFWCKSRGSLSSVCLVNPPDKFFVAVLEKDPFIRGMSSMNTIAMLCGAVYITEGVQRCSSAAPRLGQDLRARVFPQIVSLEAEFLFGVDVMGEDIPAIVSPSPLTERLASYIDEFGCVLS